MHDPRSTKFAVDIEGPGLARAGGAVAFAVSAPRGRVERNHIMRIDGPQRWRAIFEYAPADGEPVDLEGVLRGADGAALSETWRFRFVPRA